MYELVKHNGQEYRVCYNHKRVEDDKKTQAVTKAFILDTEKNVIAEAEAVCSVKDQFNKKLGRTIAKGRLVKVLETM